MVMLQGSPVTALVTAASGDTQLLATASQVRPPAASSCGLSDSDVHRILAHRRGYIKQQRAFDRACVGNEHAAFDPTQVLPSTTPLCKCSLSQKLKLRCKVEDEVSAGKAYAGSHGMQLMPSYYASVRSHGMHNSVTCQMGLCTCTCLSFHLYKIMFSIHQWINQSTFCVFETHQGSQQAVATAFP